MTDLIEIVHETTVIEIAQETTVIELAEPGVQGPPGPPGPAGGEAFQHTQGAPAAEWILNHNLGRRPNVATYTPGWVEFEAEVVHVSENQARVLINQPLAGFATCS